MTGVVSGNLTAAEVGKVILVLDLRDAIFVSGFFSALIKNLDSNSTPEPVRLLVHELKNPLAYRGEL